MKYEKSCGAVPYRKTSNGIEFLIIKHISGHWGFPKGHVETGETDLETAVRELKEETGLEPQEVDISTPLIERYEYKMGEEIIGKTVVYFLIETKDQPTSIQHSEISDFSWADFESALALLTFDESKQVLTKANNSIKGENEK